jgi:predicted methyltransferase
MRPLALAVLLLASPAFAQHEGPLVHRFDRPAEEYAKHFDAPGRDRWQKPREVVKLLALKPGMTVVDLGAGTGYFVPHLSRAVGATGKVLALDVEPQLVAHIEERAKKAKLANVAAKQVPLDDPQLDLESVDRVLIVDTWHHIADREKYAAKLAAGLKPDGFVAIVDITMESPHGPPKHHRLAAEAVKQELEAGGLVAKVVKEGLPRQYVVVGRRPAPER